ncbi:MAG: hypothetical protein HOP19_11665, partial [Acidobacteria bacterium]|nr:hypothetical protein [Acidobacteriota bacterium]
FFNNLEGLNADNAEKVPRPLYRYNSFGYEIGGPVYLPRFGSGGKAVKKVEKLYFYANQEFYRQLVPPNTPLSERLIRVPTAKERAGDFSDLLLLPTPIYLRDPMKPGKCDASNLAACLPENKIPVNRWYGSGQAILNLFPLPNRAGAAANQPNYLSQLSHDSPRREDIVRVDYEPTEKTEIAARLINNSDQQLLNYAFNGNLPAFRLNFPLAPVRAQRPGVNFALMVTHAFNETTVNELIVGPSRNRIAIRGADDRLTTQANHLNFPLLFPQANRGDLLPTMTFGGVGTSTPSTLFLGGPFESRNLIWNVTDNFTRIWRDHTIKAGVFWQRARKNENVPGLPFFTSANVEFGSGSNFTGSPFANALLGEYATYQQANRAIAARYRFNTVEGYLQDLWRVNDRLVLDFGLRVSWIQPQYDKNLQLTSFNPALYDRAKAPRLYQPTLVPVGPNKVRMAVDPNDPSNVKPESFIGLLVPGTGDVNNGFGLAQNGYSRGGFDDRGAHFGPRFGFAYDLFGDGRTILRGGAGIFYDRMEGNRLRELFTNPPNVTVPKLLNGNLSQIETFGRQSLNDPRGNVSLAPPVAVGIAQDGKLPTVYSYNLNLQRDIGWETVIDVAYVGTLGRHLMQARNLNAVPYGTLFEREAVIGGVKQFVQDASKFGGEVPESDPNLTKIYQDAELKFNGGKALPRDLLRPFPGFNEIYFREFVGSSNYHSLQVSARRRFSRDLTFGLAYTWGKAFATANQDQEVSSLGGARDYDYRLASYDRRHLLAVNYIYNLPKVSRWMGDNPIAKALFDGWKISGISQFATGSPLELTGNLAGGLTRDASDSFGAFAQNLTGSYTDGPRVYLRYDPYEQLSGSTSYLNPASLFFEQPGNVGPWPRQYWRTPNTQNHDLALFKEVPLNDNGQYVQLRFEMFNTFNHTQFTNLKLTGRNDSNQLVLDPTILDNDTRIIVRTRQGDFYNFGKGTASSFPAGCEAVAGRPNVCFIKQDRSNTPLGQWFGEPTAARSGRVIQLGFKLNF